MASKPTTTSVDQKGSSPSAMSESSKLDVSKFEQECLDEHNRLRAHHGCPPLKLNRNLCTYALEWANNLARRNSMEHRTEMKYGENIFTSTGYDVDGKLPVKCWYDEISKYNFKKPGFALETGHFTQVVWKGTHELGIAIVKKGRNIWVVANYNPPGNFLKEFDKNVPKSKK